MSLGLLEMTRKRTRESLNRTMHETCFYCDGTGQIQSRTTIAYEILRQIRREKSTLSGYSVLVNAHPAVVDLMQARRRPRWSKPRSATCGGSSSTRAASTTSSNSIYRASNAKGFEADNAPLGRALSVAPIVRLRV